MAQLLGETEFGFTMQEGQWNNVDLIRVGDLALLIAVFDNRTTAGMVRLLGQRTAKHLLDVLREEPQAVALAPMPAAAFLRP